MSAFLGIVVGSVTGGFNANVDAGDEKILEAGFDISQARTDQILGHKLALMDALPAFFALISMLLEKLTLSEICEFPKSDLESARNDVRSAINTVINLYEATSPIYGPTALGLRQAAWVARKSSPNTKVFYVLVFAALRRYSNFFLDHQRISDLENAAGISLKNLEALQKLQQTPQFKESLSNKSFRESFVTPQFRPSDIHKAIFDLDCRIVASLNFDKIYETYAIPASENTIVVKNYYDDDVRQTVAGTDRYIIKPHGTVDTISLMIFTLDDYAHARIKHSSFYEMMTALLHTHTFGHLEKFALPTAAQIRFKTPRL